MGCTDKRPGRQMAQRRVAIRHLLAVSANAVLVEPARTEAVDGERHVSGARQPVCPGNHGTVEATASMQEHDGWKRPRSRWPGHVADQPNRGLPGPTLDVNELARRGVGAGNGHRDQQTCKQTPHGHAAAPKSRPWRRHSAAEATLTSVSGGRSSGPEWELRAEPAASRLTSRPGRRTF